MKPVTILRLIVLSLIPYYFLRLANAIFFWAILEETNAPALYMALTGAFWVIIFIAHFALSYRLEATLRVVTYAIYVAYLLFYWGELLWWRQNNLAIPVSISLILLLSAYFLDYPHTFFPKESETHEH